MLWHLKPLFTIENGLKKLPSKTIDLKKLKKVTLEDALIKVLSSPNHTNKSVDY